jgi:hypothetical protein
MGNNKLKLKIVGPFQRFNPKNLTRYENVDLFANFICKEDLR